MSIKNTTIIVGAGLSGLIAAHRLQQNGKKVLLLEKSKGLGGRMATRRDENATFDHGAQFFKVSRQYEEPKNYLGFIEDSCKKNWLQPWFENEKSLYLAAQGGLTTLAKNLALGLEIKKEQKVVKITQHSASLEVACESGQQFVCDQLILSAPLPQSLELLKASQISYDSQLEAVVYAKALIGLLELAENWSKAPYLESVNENIFSISEQKSKAVSSATALTLTMSPAFSETHFAKSDDEILILIQKAFSEWAQSQGLSLKIQKSQAKKWRYSHPLQKLNTLSLALSQSPRIHLIGDAFGGSSLKGAFLSGDSIS